MRKLMIIALVQLCMCLHMSGSGWTLTYSDLIVFGDSLSDTGNVARLTGGFIPPPPYYEGRFTNGPNYIDYMAAALSHDAVPYLAGGDNFAFGGARTSLRQQDPSFSVLGQVALYQASGRAADPHALYVVFAGSNNLVDVVPQVASQPNGSAIGTQAVQRTIGDIAQSLNTLKGMGARHVLVPNAPNLGLVPQVMNQGPQTSAVATALSQSFNFTLETVLNGETALDIKRLDTFSLLNKVAADPASFGFSNATSPCYSGNVTSFYQSSSVCSSPNLFLYWDGLHPTTAGHALLANAAINAVVVNPEPATWTLLSLGLAGLAMRQAFNKKLRDTRQG
jgi:outer membrane lipase/esterase